MTEQDILSQELSGKIWNVLLTGSDDDRDSLLYLIESICGVDTRIKVEEYIERNR